MQLLCAMEFTFAHISDVHLSPLPDVRWRELVSKRLTGYINWRRSRHRIHQRAMVDLLTSDIRQQKIDHWAVTGDLANLGLPAEFVAARHWLETLGTPDIVSLVPGNHDAYVPLVHKSCFDVWAEYMCSDEMPDNETAKGSSHRFPYVKRRGPIAFIGVSSAVPTLPFVAAGELGAAQLSRLSNCLKKLEEEGLFRVLLIHHPPIPGLASKRRGLRDCTQLADVLTARGCELVLYGHNHKHKVSRLEGEKGPIHIIGTPSASNADPGHPPLAAYNLFKVTKSDEGWGCTMWNRGLRHRDGAVEQLEMRLLEYAHGSPH